MLNIWFWQRIVSPHMAELAVALARSGAAVSYIAENELSEHRMQQGWKAPELLNVRKELISNTGAVRNLVKMAPENSIHICQGVRANGLVACAQTTMAERGLQQWVVIDTVNDSGWVGALKRMEYSRIFRARAKTLQGVLAIGYRTVDWVVARGVPFAKVYPFAYFLSDKMTQFAQIPRQSGPMRFMFAGQLITLKRVDWLINALADLTDQPFELWVVGSGPEEVSLRSLAAAKLKNRVLWLGQLSLLDVPAVMAQADCLVLPSLHDGWGAVASEAMMVGTPVICSDKCGVAGVVRQSGYGGVFPFDEMSSFRSLLSTALVRGPVHGAMRSEISEWAKCLGAGAGASYLLQILAHDVTNEAEHSIAPWDRNRISS